MVGHPRGWSRSVSVTGDVGGNLVVGDANQIVEDAAALLGSPRSIVLEGAWSNLPRMAAKMFVGRDDALAELDAVAGRSAVVSGLGGGGKTELVRSEERRVGEEC